MNRAATTAALVAALAGGFLYVTQDPAECADGDPHMMVVQVHTPASVDEDGTPIAARCSQLPITVTCGQPASLLRAVWDEEREIPCGDLAPGEVRRVLTADAYPESLVGYVGRHAHEGEWPTAAVAPAWSVCQGRGCYCAGEPEQCEAIPIGGPNGASNPMPYWCLRLKRLHPEATC